MKRYIGLLLLVFSSLAYSQSATISGTIVDSNGVVWANATVTASLTNSQGINPKSYVWSGGTLNPTPAPVTADTNGIFSITLPATYAITPVGSTWTIKVCPMSSLPCMTTQFPLYGNTDISSSLTPFLKTGIQPTNIVRVQQTAQAISPVPGSIIYNNVTNAPNFWNGSSWNVFAAGGNGTVTNFSALTSNWPSWLVPFVTNSTTTPALGVTASAIPNSALQYSSTTINGVTCTLGAGCTISGGSGLPAATAAQQTLVSPSAGTTYTPTALANVALSGSATDIQTGNLTLPTGFMQNYYFPPASNRTTNGGGYSQSLGTNIIDSVNGTRSCGNTPGCTTNQWYQTHAFNINGNFSSMGITEGLFLNVVDGKTGDTSVVRVYSNWVEGGGNATSDEIKKMLYMYMNPMQTYRGVVTNSPGTGGTGVYTNMTSGCGAIAAYDNNCAGSGHMALRTTSTIYSGTVASATRPSSGAYGVMATNFSVTPSVAIATMSTDLPDVTNQLTGDTNTFPISVVSGTVPSSGWLCLSSGLGTAAEGLQYTYSAPNLTIQAHRYPILGASSSVYIFFGDSCRSISPQLDGTSEGGRSNYYFLGAVDSTHVAYTSYIRGARDSPMYYGGNFKFRPGVGGANTIDVYQAAMVIGTNDPLITPSPYQNIPLHLGNPHDGYLLLAANNIPWANGDSVELAYEPSTQSRGIDLYCNANIPASFSAQACIHKEINGQMSGGTETVYNNVSSFHESISGGGSFGDMFISQVTPTSSMFHFTNCMYGDASSTCTGSGSYMIWGQDKMGDTMSMTLNMATHTPTFTLPNLIFARPFTATPGTLIGASDPLIPEGTYAVINAAPNGASYAKNQNDNGPGALYRQTDAVAGSECTTGGGTLIVTCEVYKVSFGVYALRPVGMTATQAAQYAPVQKTGTITGSGNAAACFNAAGQLYRSTTTSCP